MKFTREDGSEYEGEEAYLGPDTWLLKRIPPKETSVYEKYAKSCGLEPFKNGNPTMFSMKLICDHIEALEKRVGQLEADQRARDARVEELEKFKERQGKFNTAICDIGDGLLRVTK